MSSIQGHCRDAILSLRSLSQMANKAVVFLDLKKIAHLWWKLTLCIFMIFIEIKSIASRSLAIKF
ncbi:hypothetical protein ACUN3I_02275 [Hafnia alvei]